VSPPNLLKDEPSLYLRQHKENPVFWHPFSEEVFKKAEEKDLPVFLSIGYSSCHWCHVMEKESFEDPEIGEVLNRYFIPVKVDREEHREVDAYYMQSAMLFLGHGGWPLNVFCLPDGKPFFAITYLPPRGNGRQLGFLELLLKIREMWERERSLLKEDAEKVFFALKEFSRWERRKGDLPDPRDIFLSSTRDLDLLFGGISSAPKFPPYDRFFFYLSLKDLIPDLAPQIRLVLQHHLDKIVFSSALRDILSGGFHRYTVDEGWRIPHFEKMLYDQAFWLMILSRFYGFTSDPLYRVASLQIFEELTRNWVTPTSLYASAFDADDPLGEGYYYTFLPEEVLSACSEDVGSFAVQWFRIESLPELDGRSTLYPVSRPDNPTYHTRFGGEETFKKLYSQALSSLRGIREKRIPPVRDEKGVVGWNGWALLALFDLFRVYPSLSVKKEIDRILPLFSQMAKEGTIPQAIYPEGVRGKGGFLEWLVVGYSLFYGGIVTDTPSYLADSLSLLKTFLSRYYPDGEWRYESPDFPSIAISGVWDEAPLSPLYLLLKWLSELSLFFPEKFQSLKEEFSQYALSFVQKSPLHSLPLLSVLYSIKKGGGYSVIPEEGGRFLSYLPLLPHPVLPIFPKVYQWLTEEGSSLPSNKKFSYCAQGTCYPEKETFTDLLPYLIQDFPYLAEKNREEGKDHGEKE
jgi:hypothetical protein